MPYADPERRREFMHQYYLNHREKMLKNHSDNHAANREKRNAHKREQYRANPEEKRENQRRQIKIAGVYLGMCGRTRKQREQFLRDLNGEINGS